MKRTYHTNGVLYDTGSANHPNKSVIGTPHAVLNISPHSYSVDIPANSLNINIVPSSAGDS